jgi:hypothetical protein
LSSKYTTHAQERVRAHTPRTHAAANLASLLLGPLLGLLRGHFDVHVLLSVLENKALHVSLHNSRAVIQRMHPLRAEMP